jgi:hypothetical protein
VKGLFFMPDPHPPNEAEWGHQQLRDEVKKKRGIVVRWMKDIQVPQRNLEDFVGGLQTAAYASIRTQLNLLALFAPESREEDCSIWDACSQCIPMEKKQIIPQEIVSVLQSPLAGDPETVLAKTNLMKIGGPLLPLLEGVRKNLSDRQKSVYALLTFSLSP